MKPPMTPQQVAEVQASFAKLAPMADQAAALFYRRLFEEAPQLRPLFTTDMTVQGRKLMATIATVVNALDDIEAIAPAVCDLAKRHVGYGVRAEHYEMVGTALLWTLERGLGDQFTAAVRAGWVSAYGALSQIMIAAAYPGGAQ
jgi:hemoglobin-like flavoprotein